MQKQLISNSQWRAEHPLAGQNTQHTYPRTERERGDRNPVP